MFLAGLGSIWVLFVKEINTRVFSILLGFSGGIMISVSFWSLLNPAIELSRNFYSIFIFPVVVGFILGIIFLRVIDLIVPHLHIASSVQEQEGPKISLEKGILIFLAITIHNIPEGIAIGVSFGSVLEEEVFLRDALTLTLGIGIQNIPEGLVVSLALRQAKITKTKSFLFGFFSATVEPIFSVLGTYLTTMIQVLLPYALSFAAGAMIFITIEDLLPEAQKYGNSDLVSIGFGIGFLVMMILNNLF